MPSVGPDPVPMQYMLQSQLPAYLRRMLQKCTGGATFCNNTLEEARDAHGSIGANDGGGCDPIVGGKSPSEVGGHWGGLAEGDGGKQGVEEESGGSDVHAHGDCGVDAVDGWG
jgi:hypothetical protein